MLIYILVFYLLILVLFEDLISKNSSNYLIVFFITLIISFIFYKFLGNPVKKFENYLKIKYKKLYGFSFYFIPEIVVTVILISIVFIFR